MSTVAPVLQCAVCRARTAVATGLDLCVGRLGLAAGEMESPVAFVARVLVSSVRAFGPSHPSAVRSVIR